jgi:hypothetical protein
LDLQDGHPGKRDTSARRGKRSGFRVNNSLQAGLNPFLLRISPWQTGRACTSSWSSWSSCFTVALAQPLADSAGTKRERGHELRDGTIFKWWQPARETKSGEERKTILHYQCAIRLPQQRGVRQLSWCSQEKGVVKRIIKTQAAAHQSYGSRRSLTTLILHWWSRLARTQPMEAWGGVPGAGLRSPYGGT